MTHDEYLANIDPFLDGNLDFVEVVERQFHESQCDHNCIGSMIARAWERLDERGGFLWCDPEPCLRDNTLRRWAWCDLSAELLQIATDHIEHCDDCARRANVYLAEQMEQAQDSTAPKSPE